jgi:general L-amino acid transport system substrate-binding protein
MVEAEEYGLSSKNVDEMKASSSNPQIKRHVGTEGDMGKSLGLPNDWCYNVVKQVGNYGESYARHVGPETPLNLSRGVNAQWKDGGLQYAMPIR